ncbi:hypothetical protein [Vibrio mangrovi]|uniref:hypothetical protein n=1 Tax=Vibrio mangrovi TaxID=474394 RepID=UPI000B3BCD72|nr:hypothetical protein [Vibrio mangrovi]
MLFYREFPAILLVLLLNTDGNVVIFAVGASGNIGKWRVIERYKIKTASNDRFDKRFLYLLEGAA